MTEPTEAAAQRDRSPAFPIVPLETALNRLTEFEAHFKRSAARPEKVGEAWGINARAYADRIAAALRYFGLLEYQGTGKDRSVVVSDDGRKYLRAQQEETKRQVVKTAALRPKQIAKFWAEWGADRPANAACLDALMLDNGFSEVGARDFLKVYDATIAYAKLSRSDKLPVLCRPVGESEDESNDIEDTAPEVLPPHSQGSIRLMDGERIVFVEEFAPRQYVKLIASGDVDWSLLDAIEDYVKRQKKRLETQGQASSSASTPQSKA
jgi:hypothetical protein